MQFDWNGRWPSFIPSKVDSRDVAGVMLRMVVVIVVVVEVAKAVSSSSRGGLTRLEEATSKPLFPILVANLKEGILYTLHIIYTIVLGSKNLKTRDQIGCHL